MEKTGKMLSLKLINKEMRNPNSDIIINITERFPQRSKIHENFSNLHELFLSIEEKELLPSAFIVIIKTLIPKPFKGSLIKENCIPA